MFWVDINLQILSGELKGTQSAGAHICLNTISRSILFSTKSYKNITRWAKTHSRVFSKRLNIKQNTMKNEVRFYRYFDLSLGWTLFKLRKTGGQVTTVPKITVSIKYDMIWVHHSWNCCSGHAMQAKVEKISFLKNTSQIH